MTSLGIRRWTAPHGAACALVGLLTLPLSAEAGPPREFAGVAYGTPTDDIVASSDAELELSAGPLEVYVQPYRGRVAGLDVEGHERLIFRGGAYVGGAQVITKVSGANRDRSFRAVFDALSSAVERTCPGAVEYARPGWPLDDSFDEPFVPVSAIVSSGEERWTVSCRFEAGAQRSVTLGHVAGELAIDNTGTARDDQGVDDRATVGGTARAAPTKEVTAAEVCAAMGDHPQRPSPQLLADLVNATRPERFWGEFQPKAKAALERGGHTRERWQRLSRALLVVGWAGGLHDPEALGRFIDAACADWAVIDPDHLARSAVGEARATAVVDALEYRAKRRRTFDPPHIPGMGILLVYRPGNVIGSAIPLVPSVGPDVIGVLGSSRYTWVYLPPGHHWVEATTEARATLRVDVAEGEITPVRLTIQTGMLIGRPDFDADEELDVVLDGTRRWGAVDPPWAEVEHKAPSASME